MMIYGCDVHFVLYNDVIRALTHVSRFLQHCIQQDYLIYKKSFLSTVYANVSASRFTEYLYNLISMQIYV